jgi:hypothetical protein
VGIVLLPRQLGVDDAAAGRHPLHVAVGEDTGVATIVGVAQVAVEHERHGLDAAVRVVRKSGRRLELVLDQHQKGVGGLPVARRDQHAVCVVGPLVERAGLVHLAHKAFPHAPTLSGRNKRGARISNWHSLFVCRCLQHWLRSSDTGTGR